MSGRNSRGAGASKKALVPLLKLVFYGALGVFFWYAFDVRYWEWRDCISRVETSCTEPGAWNATEAGQFWAIPALIFSLLAVKAAVIAVLRMVRPDDLGD